MSKPPDPQAWQTDVQSLWDKGQCQEALDLLLQRINALQPAVPRLLGLQLSYYVFTLGDLAGAERFLRQLLIIHPNDLEITENLAVMVGRQGRAGEAVQLFQKVLQLAGDKASANVWDGLAANLAEVQRYDKAREAGSRALALKTEAARPLPGWEPPSTTPSKYLQRDGYKQRDDVIAFSLWGDNPRYLCGALRNTLLIPELYPGWQARFYMDETVPEDIRSLLKMLGADCHIMPTGQSMRKRLCWRFQVANDYRVGRFLVRDCDSVVNQREVAAVMEWVASDQWFHAMRDWWTHTDPVLAGMWGGVAGVLPQLETLLNSYVPKSKETANIDQWFLRDVLWGSIRDHTLVHDRCFSTEGSHQWPLPTPQGNYHVGQNEFAVNRKMQARWLTAWINEHPSLRLKGEDPKASQIKREVDNNQYLVARSSNVISAEDRPKMPKYVSGWIINLAEAKERWCAMKKQIDELDWGGTHKRFEAHRATESEAKEAGLNSAGQLGLWRSSKAVLEQWLNNDPPADGVLHLIEDDAILHPTLPFLLETLRTFNPQLDLLFTEAFLTVPLYRRFQQLEQQRQRNKEGIRLLNGGQYLACTSSVLITCKGAQRLLNEMNSASKNGKVAVNDIFYRQLIREEKIHAAISLPFFSTIRLDTDSWLQGYRDKKVQRSQQVDLYLRQLLYNETWKPEACKSIATGLLMTMTKGLNPTEIGELASEMIELSRRKGWTESY